MVWLVLLQLPQKLSLFNFSNTRLKTCLLLTVDSDRILELTLKSQLDFHIRYKCVVITFPSLNQNCNLPDFFPKCAEIPNLGTNSAEVKHCDRRHAILQRESWFRLLFMGNRRLRIAIALPEPPNCCSRSDDFLMCFAWVDWGFAMWYQRNSQNTGKV